MSQAQTAQILCKVAYRLVSPGKNKDQTKTKTPIQAKKELANNLFASFSIMRQTGLECKALVFTPFDSVPQTPIYQAVGYCFIQEHLTGFERFLQRIVPK